MVDTSRTIAARDDLQPYLGCELSGGHHALRHPLRADLVPLSLLYALASTPKLLLFLQTAAIGSSVWPIYLLARRRLHHPAWGLAFGALFLLSPAVQTAVVDDFHPEVFAAPLLLWALYFLETRRDRWLIVACVVTLLCKETLPLTVFCLGIYVAFGRGRQYLGRWLCGLSLGAVVVALLLMHFTSPLGHSPLTSRFDPLLQHPLSSVLAMLVDPRRQAYVAGLFAQVGFLALLSPWMVAIIVPSMMLNVVSSNVNMFSGGAQYNVDLAPFLIVGAMDGLVRLKGWLPGLARWSEDRLRRVAPIITLWSQTRLGKIAPSLARALGAGLRRVQTVLPVVARRVGYQTMTAVVLVAVWGLGMQQSLWRDYDQYAAQGWWPAQTAHTCLAYGLLALIPAHASVSAESWLVPHLSERMDIYQFPSGVERADYILLDVTTGSYYPFQDPADYVSAFQQLLNSGDFELMAAQDGYLLLKRLPLGLRASLGHPLTLPPSFFTFATDVPPNTNYTTLVRYLSEAQMFGYDASAVASQQNAVQPPLVHASSNCPD